MSALAVVPQVLATATNSNITRIVVGIFALTIIRMLYKLGTGVNLFTRPRYTTFGLAKQSLHNIAALRTGIRFIAPAIMFLGAIPTLSTYFADERYIWLKIFGAGLFALGFVALSLSEKRLIPTEIEAKDAHEIFNQGSFWITQTALIFIGGNILVYDICSKQNIQHNVTSSFAAIVLCAGIFWGRKPRLLNNAKICFYFLFAVFWFAATWSVRAYQHTYEIWLMLMLFTAGYSLFKIMSFLGNRGALLEKAEINVREFGLVRRIKFAALMSEKFYFALMMLSMMCFIYMLDPLRSVSGLTSQIRWIGTGLSNLSHRFSYEIDWFLGLCAVGCGAYWLRCVHRVKYGFLEMIVGAAVMWLALVGIKQLDATQSTSINGLLTILGGLYVIVRGLDNVEKGLEIRESAFLPLWQAIFHSRWHRLTGQREGAVKLFRALY